MKEAFLKPVQGSISVEPAERRRSHLYTAFILQQGKAAPSPTLRISPHLFLNALLQ